MTFSEIWNTIEHMFSENVILAQDANEFFGIVELDEILTKDSLSIRFRKLTNTYEVTFNTNSKMVSFSIKRFANTSYQRSEYELIIEGTLNVAGSANEVINSKEMNFFINFFIKYMRDWKLKKILK